VDPFSTDNATVHNRTQVLSEEIKEKVKNSLGGSVEEMLRARGWNTIMEMTDDAKKRVSAENTPTSKSV
jgi:hypothetical protein